MGIHVCQLNVSWKAQVTDSPSCHILPDTCMALELSSVMGSCLVALSCMYHTCCEYMFTVKHFSYRVHFVICFASLVPKLSFAYIQGVLCVMTFEPHKISRGSAWYAASPFFVHVQGIERGRINECGQPQQY